MREDGVMHDARARALVMPRFGFFWLCLRSSPLPLARLRVRVSCVYLRVVRCASGHLLTARMECGRRRACMHAWRRYPPPREQAPEGRETRYHPRPFPPLWPPWRPMAPRLWVRGLTWARWAAPRGAGADTQRVRGGQGQSLGKAALLSRWRRGAAGAPLAAFRAPVGSAFG